MSQNREKERCQSVREVLEALEKLEARIFAERHIPLLRIAAAGSRSGIGVTHTALGAVRYLRQKGVSCLYREQNDTGAVRRLASWYGMVPDEHGIYYMDGLVLKPRYSDVVQLEQPVFEVILETAEPGSRRFWRGSMIDSFRLWIAAVGERRFSAGDPVSGSRRGTPDFIKSQKIRAGLSSGGGPAS